MNKINFNQRDAGQFSEVHKVNIFQYENKNKIAELNINYFNYDYKRDDNNDGFTDVTLQDRVSVFQKWNFKRKDYRLFSLAGRFLYEDRWGGDMDWTPDFRGGDSLYGESIYTTRYELLVNYQLPTKEKLFLSGSFNPGSSTSILFSPL